MSSPINGILGSMCEKKPWLTAETSASASIWASCTRTMPGRTDSLQESGRATAPPNTAAGCESLPRYPGTTQYAPFPQTSSDPNPAAPRYTPNYSDLNFFTKPKLEEKAESDVGAHLVTKHKQDTVADTLLSFLQKKSEGECSVAKETGGKRRRKENAMSHYPDDAKRVPGYDYYQWDHRGEGASGRRNHLPFCGTPQTHGWGPMAMGSPYFPNPHMVPAHAHSTPDYRFNQWTPPSKLQHAHSQPKLPAAVKPADPPLLDPLTDLQALVSSREQQESVDLRLPGPAGLKAEKPVQLTVTRLDTADKEISSTNDGPDANLKSKSEPARDTSFKAEASLPLRAATSNGIHPVSPHKMEAVLSQTSAPSPMSQKTRTPPVAEKARDEIAATPPKSQVSGTSLSQLHGTPMSQLTSTPIPQDKGSLGPQTPGTPPRSHVSGTSESPSPTTSASPMSGTYEPREVKTPKESPVAVGEKLNTPVENIGLERVSTPPATSSDVPNDSADKVGIASSPFESTVGEDVSAALPPNESSSVMELVTQSVTQTPVPTPIMSQSETPPVTPTVTQSGDTLEEKPAAVEPAEESPPKPAESLPTVSSTSADVKPVSKESFKKKRPARKRGRGTAAKQEAKKAKIVKPPKSVIERRGPVLHIKGSRDSPVTVAVLNAPRADEDDTAGARVRAPPPARDFRRPGRARNGLFSSTLSARYDARTADPTWVCVFCKQGPHWKGLGDLFGPYVVVKDPSNELCEFSGDENDIVDAQRRGGRNKKSIRANNLMDYFQMSRKLKRSQSIDAARAMSGLTPLSDDEGESPRYEVWVHEPCAVWSPGVCLVDTRLMGLQEAVWHCQQAKCSSCGESGANLGCIHRNCPNRSHYACARETGWSLPEDTFISTCHYHVQRS